MKKITAILAAAMIILSAAGCSGNTAENNDTTTSTTTGEKGKVTQVVYSNAEPDTSEQAMSFLEQNAPYIAGYFKTRRQYPLTYETSIEKDGAIYKAGIYIRDGKSLAVSSTDPDGNETRVVYKDGKVYQIESAEKVVYFRDYREDIVEDLVQSYLVKLSIDNVTAADYVANEKKEFKGKEYSHESITSGENTVDYYFETESGDIKYIVNSEEISEILVLNNEPKESAFDIPSDYEMKDFDEYAASVQTEKTE